jgi:hypothetical protein
VEEVMEGHGAWFETADIGGGKVRRASKFLNREFGVSVEFLESRWSSWTRDERIEFASAFSARNELSSKDRAVLVFLTDKGGPDVWRSIALLIAKHEDRSVALEFLVRRVKEGILPLANYYQALAILQAPECVPTLVESLSKHRAEVEKHPSLQTWGERFLYLDFIASSATLLKITGKDEFRSNLKEMLEHPDKTIRQMVHTVVQVSGITI